MAKSKWVRKVVTVTETFEAGELVSRETVTDLDREPYADWKDDPEPAKAEPWQWGALPYGGGFVAGGDDTFLTNGGLTAVVDALVDNFNNK